MLLPSESKAQAKDRRPRRFLRERGVEEGGGPAEPRSVGDEF